MNINPEVEKFMKVLRDVEGAENYIFSFRRKDLGVTGIQKSLNNRNQVCLTPGCLRLTYDSLENISGGRGLCHNCYSNTLNKVKRGKVTWEGLEAQGLALPKMTLEERRANQSHPHRSFKKSKEVKFQIDASAV